MEVQTQVEIAFFMSQRGAPSDLAPKGAPFFVLGGVHFQADGCPRRQGGIGQGQEPVTAFIEEIYKMRNPVRRSGGSGIVKGIIKGAYFRD